MQFPLKSTRIFMTARKRSSPTLNASFTIVTFFIAVSRLRCCRKCNFIFNPLAIILDRHDMARISRELLDFSLFEEACLTNCPNCYANVHAVGSGRHHTSCSTLHLLLNVKLRNFTNFWAAEQGFRSWPAILVAIHDKLKTIRIIFFDSERFFDTIPLNCNIYSTNNSLSIPKLDDRFKNALTVFDIEFTSMQFHLKN